MTTWDDAEGAVLEDRYEVGERLGRGGDGVVHRAWDRARQRSVAVKLLPPGTGLVEPRAGRSEADILAALDHPNLVALHDVLATEDGPVLVMELVDGPSLHDRLEDGPLPLADAATVLRDVAAGLSHAHRRGVVHRDVKPGNVLLRLDGERIAEAKLADFGIARRADATRTTAERTVVGTVRFVSPEQLRGDRVTDVSDVYSLGLTVLTAVTGADPFPGQEAESLAARLVRPPTVPDDLPTDWAELLRGMTALDPLDRPDASAVAAAACTLGEALPVAAVFEAGRITEPVAVARSARIVPPRRHRTARAVTLGGSVAVLGAALGAALAFAFAPAAVEQVLVGPTAAPPAATAKPDPTAAAPAPTAAAGTPPAFGTGTGTGTVAGTAATPAPPVTAGDRRGRGSDDTGKDDSRGRGSAGSSGHGSSGHGSSGKGSGGHGSDD